MSEMVEMIVEGGMIRTESASAITIKPIATYDMTNAVERRKAPRRTKKRCVLKSVGKKLKTRRSLLQIVKAIHDSLRGGFGYFHHGARY